MSWFGSVVRFAPVAALVAAPLAIVPLTTSAQAALTESWSAATSLSTSSTEADDADVQVSQDGTRATAVWKYWDGSRAVIQSASATVTGSTASWGSVTDLSPNDVSAFGSRVALSADGSTAVAIWTTFSGSVQMSVGSVSGGTATWGSAATIADGYASATSPTIGISNDGTLVTAAWVGGDVNDRVYSASATVAGTAATWGSATAVSEADQDAADPDLAVSEDGRLVTAVWVRSDDDNERVQSASASVSVAGVQSWQGVSDLSDSGEDGAQPQVDVSADGTAAAAVWGRALQLQTASATVSGAGAQSWGIATDLATTDMSAPAPDVSLSADGDVVTAVWITLTGGFQIVQQASGTVTGFTQFWGAVQDLSATGGNATTPHVRLSSDGAQATAVWARYGSNNVIQASSAIVDGAQATWESPADLSAAAPADSSNPQVALSGDGAKATAIWRRSNSGIVIQSASATLQVPDIGTAWTGVVDGASNRSLSIATDGDGTWVSGGVFGGRISTDNGVTWSTLPMLDPSGYIQRVAWCDGAERFVARTSRTGTGQMAYSADGSSWTLVDIASNLEDAAGSLACNGSRAVGVSSSGGMFSNYAMYSSDGGASWSAASSSVARHAVTYAPGIGFVAVGGTADPNTVGVSSNGSSWSSYSGQAGNWRGVGASPDGDLVAVAESGTNQVMTSSSGTSWTAATPAAANQWAAVADAAGTWVVVSGNGTNQVMTSPTGSSWTAQSAAAANNWNSVVFAAVDSGWLTTGRVLASRQAIGDTTNFMYSDAYQPGPPLQPAATPGDEDAVVSFSVPSDRGSTITDYEYSVDGGAWTSTADTTSPITIGGLTNGAPVDIRLRAVNGVSAGSPSSTVTVTPTAQPPGPTDPGESAGVLSWSAPNWASTVTQYVVVYRPNGSAAKWGVYAARTTDWPGVPPTEVWLDATVGSCGYVNDLEGWDYCPLPRGELEAGITYNFKIFARTATTLGKYSSVVTYTPPEMGGEAFVEQAGGWGADPNPAPTDPAPTAPDPEPTAPGGDNAGTVPPGRVVDDPDGAGPIVVAPDPVVPPAVRDTSPRTAPQPRRERAVLAARKVHFGGKRVTWASPKGETTVRYQIRLKKRLGAWRQWRAVGTRTSVSVGPAVTAAKVRTVVSGSQGPVVLVRRSR